VRVLKIGRVNEAKQLDADGDAVNGFTLQVVIEGGHLAYYRKP